MMIVVIYKQGTSIISVGNSWQIKYRREPSLPGSVGGTPDGSMSSIYPEDGHTRLSIEGTPNGF